MITSIKNHEDYLAALDELYILLDMPPAGMTKGDADRQGELFDMVSEWEREYESPIND